MRGAVALQHPVAGDRDLGPAARVVPLGRERVVLGVGGGREPEAPVPVEGQRRGVGAEDQARGGSAPLPGETSS